MSSRGYRGRGSFQPRGGRGRPSKLIEDLSYQPIDLISLPVLSTEPSSVAEITNVVTLGSYNWADHKIPTMLIPGGPPTWKEPELPLQLDPDSGDSFIDQNTARCPQNPLEPMIKAISVTQKALGKEFKLADERIDIVTDRNNLRKLMRFVSANGPNRDARPAHYGECRIDVQLAPNGRTLVLTRHDESTIDTSTRFKGYGHSFERATTIEPAPLVAANNTRTHISRLQSSGYHRIIRYDLLGLRFLVRFEVDAMTPASKISAGTAEAKDELEDLVNAFTHASISSSTAPPKPNSMALKQPATIIAVDGSELRYVAHGKLIPQSDIIELRTAASKFDIPWSDIYPQLFLSQTPTIKVAKHLDGRIDAINTYNIEGEALQETHNKMNPELNALTKVLTQIRDVTKQPQNQGKLLTLYWSGSGDLKVFAVQRGGRSPNDMDLKLF
ncbi:hypothetical protein BDV93DRAFT_601357 [Ceratobasidium sp. AG-I]|nr:hypothetical protein BDV93DRAFT_601357 [Ceratobasidium sp. AG-I]